MVRWLLVAMGVVLLLGAGALWVLVLYGSAGPRDLYIFGFQGMEVVWAVFVLALASMAGAAGREGA